MTFRALILPSFAALFSRLSGHATTLALAGSLGSTPAFSVTSGGVTATYTSPAGNDLPSRTLQDF